MALEIHVTGEVTGEAPLFEHKDALGGHLVVPTYRCVVKNDTGYRKDFDVTRDTYQGIRGKVLSRYGENDECPPCTDNKPYGGRIIDWGKMGFRIELYEEELSDYGEAAISGVGDYIRTHIQIHRGPGSSEGCILLAGGDEMHKSFEEHIHAALEKSHEKKIYVYVSGR